MEPHPEVIALRHGGHIICRTRFGPVAFTTMPPRNRPRPAARLRVAAVQMKFAPTIAGNLARIEAALRTAARRTADAVLFPECATTGYACDFGTLDRRELRAALAQVGAWAAQRRMNFLIGSPVFVGRSLLNCLVVFVRAGRQILCFIDDQEATFALARLCDEKGFQRH